MVLILVDPREFCVDWFDVVQIKKERVLIVANNICDKITIKQRIVTRQKC